ncbi:hypothetical protein B7R56_02465 [Pseudomonas savastanoi pv. retacarpa]|uniref:Uncharacterized protein n=1 Tax=Pseudomonas savastanoi pv. nerii TaxID=360921 RepID=A0AB73QZ77_PSESS|nr:hypothetical protein B7R56_02465 [Pseudomonas savastanoi pv. retacarpa]PAB31704.1 hypothetical protein CC205_16005 [Pseudomonas savastanoi pv. nerii]PAB33400.1 hypothetical protein CC202_08830 [Pseudomonas savastanoi]PAB38658.1 hypothetical protein CCZ00_01200 [Pseudomonas savastanoi pv. fraxini]
MAALFRYFRRDDENLLNEFKVTVCWFLVVFVTVWPASASSRPLAKLLLSARFLISHKAKKRLLHNSKHKKIIASGDVKNSLSLRSRLND